MKKIDLSIIFPSIHPDKWKLLFEQIKSSIGDYTFEIIAVGPQFPGAEFDQEVGFRFIRDFGSPSRCLQIGSTIANGTYISWLPDDAIIMGNNPIKNCLDLISTKKPIDGITVLYSEGQNFTGEQHLDLDYWIAKTHGDIQLRQVNKEWGIAPIFLYNLNNFRRFGGLDCRFEHINMNTHDLAFRIQKEGGVIYPSPQRVFASNWKAWNSNNKSPIQLAYELNDAPLFKQIYDSESPIESLISYDNWRNSDTFWKRRWD